MNTTLTRENEDKGNESIDGNVAKNDNATNIHIGASTFGDM